MFGTQFLSPRRRLRPLPIKLCRWAFSYTRLNMHLAAAASAAGGCIVVDSTRAGKRFPDSLTATVSESYL